VTSIGPDVVKVWLPASPALENGEGLAEESTPQVGLPGSDGPPALTRWTSGAAEAVGAGAK
ncbi:MAG: hypothetical protein ACR2K0_06255, partial [Acidimicrobiales bacterium]